MLAFPLLSTYLLMHIFGSPTWTSAFLVVPELPSRVRSPAVGPLGLRRSTRSPRSTTTQQYVGGGGQQGWDNANYLEGLSGSEEARQDQAQAHQEFSNRRKAFLERQEQLRNTPQGRQFYESRNRAMQQDMRNANDDGDDVDDESLWHPSSSTPNMAGGTRFQHMMNQSAKLKQQMQNPALGGGGFQEKLAVPLDDDKESDVDIDHKDDDDE